MAGVHWKTGAVVDGWDRVVAAFELLITIRRGTRIERRDIGGLVDEVDKAVSPVNLIDFYAAIADMAALEPCFGIKRMSLAQGDDGRPAIAIQGDFYPQGLVGDFSVSEPKVMSLAI